MAKVHFRILDHRRYRNRYGKPLRGLELRIEKPSGRYRFLTMYILKRMPRLDYDNHTADRSKDWTHRKIFGLN